MAELHEYEAAVLPHIASCDSVEALIEKSGLEHIKVMRALQWLSNKNFVALDYEEKSILSLSQEGTNYANSSLPELRFYKALSTEFIDRDAVLKNADLQPQEFGAAIGILKKMDLVDMKGQTFKRNGPVKKDLFVNEQALLEKVAVANVATQYTSEEQELAKTLQKRKNMISIENKKVPIFSLTAAGKKQVAAGIKTDTSVSRLTTQMLRDGSWKNKTFRKYDVAQRLPEVSGGRKHPMSALIDQIKEVFLEMGFQEMSGPWVETAFWCMDSMWIPQDHPAREEQDTFYLPYSGKLPPKKVQDAVAQMHFDGGNTGSKGYGVAWDKNEAKKLLLRTHTTATTYRTLFFDKIAQMDRCKYFYVGRVFRNEAIDATHLPEFHQVEGFVMDDGLTLRHLMGIIKEFYGKFGYDKIKFKLTYNPYTESSLEALYYDPKRKKWMELINSGIFRPESLAPFGITKPIIAWGLGVERLAMMLYNVDKLKDLVGHTSDIHWLKTYKERVRSHGNS